MQLKERVLAGDKLDDVEIIDAHMHLNYPPFYVPASDAQSMVANMDKYGIRCGISAAQLAITSAMRQGNDESLAAAAESRGRIRAYCGINPHSADALKDEIKRCFAAGAVGIKIHPSIHEVKVSDERYAPVFEYASAHGTVILSHTWGESPHCSPLDFIELIDRYPRLTILLGHAGGSFAGLKETLTAMKAKPDNLYADLTGSTQFLNRVEILCREVGADRVVFGSDSPWLEPGMGIGAVVFAEIPEEDKLKILGGNIKRLMGLD